ncbi:MAG: alpha/beta fold hydrolase [Roseiflexaceae bacterium]
MPTATVNGVQLAYRDEGAGRPLLLIHAFPLNSAMWERQIGPLARHYRVIAPDLRGFGASQIGPGAASMDQYANDLAGLLDQLGPGAWRVALGGLSMGGYIAFAFLRRYRERVDALILADTRAQADTEEGRQTREQNARLAEEQGPGAIADQMLPKLLSPHASDELRAEVRRMIVANHRAGIAAALRAMAARPDSTPLLATIDVPTTIIVGAEDSLTPPSDARAMHDAISASRLVEIARAGHLSNLEAPDPFNAAMHALLTGEIAWGGGGGSSW